MAKHQFWNIGKANAEITSGHETLDAALSAAKISTLKVDGKDVPAGDAPLAVKAAAIAGLVSSGEKSQDVSELIASNGIVAAQVEELTNKLTVANATTAAQAQQIADLQSKLATANASVEKLTAAGNTTQNLLEASNKQVISATNESNALKRTLAQHCLDVNCLSLTDEKGQPLAADAAADVKLNAALRISADDMFKSFKGAVNSAMAKTGVSLFALPLAPATSAEPKKELTGRARFVAAGLKKN